MRVLQRLGLLLVSVALVLGVGELVARAVADEAPPVPEDLPVLRTVEELGRPGTVGRHEGVLHRVNAHGLRGPERVEERPRDVFRILVVGDSVTAGWGVREEDAYPAVLERRLNEQAAPPGELGRFEVINAGLAATNAAANLRRLRKYADLYRPQLVVFGFTLNDIEGPHYRKRKRREGEETYDVVWMRALRYNQSPSYLLRALWPRLILLLASSDAGTHWSSHYALEAHGNYFENPRAWAGLKETFGSVAGEARARGLCAHVFIHTALAQLDARHAFRSIYRRVAEAARARGLTATESYPAFEGRAPRTLHVAALDSHPNAEAHALLAELLYEDVVRLAPTCSAP